MIDLDAWLDTWLRQRLTEAEAVIREGMEIGQALSQGDFGEPTGPTMTEDLITWLRAQLDADERAAIDVRKMWETRIPLGVLAGFGAGSANVKFIESWSPARVLAEIDAKRRMIREATCAVRHDDKYLRLLALPYADRPGYREEWKP